MARRKRRSRRRWILGGAAIVAGAAATFFAGPIVGAVVAYAAERVSKGRRLKA